MSVKNKCCWMFFLVWKIFFNPCLCEEEYKLNCRPKPGCDLSHCSPSPSDWAKPGFDVDFYLRRNEYHLSCEPIAGASSYVSPAKGDKGAKGERGYTGPMGRQGPKGEKGAIERTFSDANNDRDIKKLKEEFSAALSTMERRMNDKIDRMTAKMLSDITKLKSRFGLCHVKWNGICFWIEQFPNTMNYYNAVKKCTQNGGVAADIYDEDVYNLLMNYIRLNVLTTLTQYPDYWTGMRFDQQIVSPVYADGTRAKFSTWHSGRPNIGSSYTRILVSVKIDPVTRWQGMHNQSPSWADADGIICQFKP